MDVLTFALFLTFGGVGIKEAYQKVRSTSMSELAARARSFGRSRDDSAAPTEGSNEAPRLDGFKVDAGKSSFGASNPMHSAAAAARKATEVGARRVEMTSVRSDKTTSKLADRQLSVGTSETMALPAPAAAAPSATSDLPAGWIARTTPEGKAYYCNSATGVTSWTLPV